MNLVYHMMTRNMNAPQKAKFDIDLAPRELKEKTIDQQNAEQMRLLTGGKQMPKPVPLKDRKARK